MTISNFQRNYNFTDGELRMFLSNLCNFMTRDLSDLAIFGVTALSVKSLETLGNTFEVLPLKQYKRY
ncbi:MAG: hypothetical protein NT007_07935 [Candidatus Kapabacteria bacterium]|nr:hypothetical protein [Candidatus Kapabacteria bacterium]